MISPYPENNGLGIVDLPGDRSGAFEAPIFDLGLFDTFAVSSTKKSPASGLGREQTATAPTFFILISLLAVAIRRAADQGGS
jgi:hypothetical protein